MAIATRIPARYAEDLCATLARLQLARTVGDESEERVAERRLNWLLDQLPRSKQ